MKIVIADDLPASAADLLRAVPGWIVDARAARPAPEILDALADADALIVRSATKVTRDLIAAAPHLRVIARAGTGVDNVDLEAATARGIVVMNAPGANSISVAELAMAFILALARPIPAADAAMKAQKWEKKKFTGSEVRGKTLGIVGLGRIGQEVAQRARAFEMQIMAHDPYISAPVAAQYGAKLGTLDEVCAAADYLTLHLPVTARDPAHHERRPAGALQARHSHREHRARRADRRCRAHRGAEERPGRRRGAGRVRARNLPPTGPWPACRTSSPPRTSPHPPARRRRWWGWKPPRPCVISSRTASSATR